MKLHDKVAIVTGASRGIGKEIAIALAKEGAKVYIVSRHKDDLEAVINENEALRSLLFEYEADLTNEDNVDNMISYIVEKEGCIDYLINNAGGYSAEMYTYCHGKQPLDIWDWDINQWNHILNTNLNTTFLCINKVLPEMIKKGSGRVINISSRMGRIASPMGAYAVAKAAIIALTKTAAIQAEKFGIQVNAISPGMLDTPGQRRYNHAMDKDDLKMGSANDIVGAVFFLLCDAPDYMVGQSIDLFKTV